MITQTRPHSLPIEASARERNRNRSLDGLRAVAIALVLAYHLDVRWLPGGFVGVDLFFVLSGYLITALLVAESDRSETIQLGRFLRRRVRRIWPLAWIVLAAITVAGLAGVWGADRQASLAGETTAALANVANWWTIGHGGYVESFTAPSPLRHFWSLAVEEQFYLLWAVVLVGVLAAARRRRSAAALPAVTVTVLGAASIALGFVVPSSWAYLATPTRAVELLAGAALALWWRRWPLSGPDRPAHRRSWGAAALAGGFIVAVVAASATPEDEWLATGGFALIGVAGVGLVAGALCGPMWFRRWLGSGLLVWIGVRSYAIYLLHWPLIVAFGPGAEPRTRAVVVVVGSITGAAVLHRVVERPIQLRQPSMRTLAWSGTVLLAVAAAALVTARPTEPTPTQLAAETFTPVTDPTSASPHASCASVATPVARSAPPTGFDPGTVADVVDPAASCETVRLMVVGDSTGRGTSNGLVRAADPQLSVWDRTHIGCSFNPECERPWRDTFREGIDTVDPDVVLLYGGVVDDLADVDDAEFLSPEGRAQRVATLVEAARILSSRGAALVFTTPAAPRPPNGLFFCDGRARASRCDPAWTDEWNESVRSAATRAGAAVIDVGSWIEARPDPAATRPDGLHLSSEALVDLGRWLAPQLLALTTTPP